MVEESTDAAVEYPLPTGARILNVMAAIGNIGKDGENKAQGYNFRAMEAIAPRVRDAMVVHGLIAVPVGTELVAHETREREKSAPIFTDAVRITYHFMSADDTDDVIEAQTIGLASDTFDKSVSKAMTAAHKSLLLQTFCIGDGGDDPDAQSPGANTDDMPANDQDVETCADALKRVNGADLDVVRAWCKAMNFGSITNRHVRAAAVPGFLALVDALKTTPAIPNDTLNNAVVD